MGYADSKILCLFGVGWPPDIHQQLTLAHHISNILDQRQKEPVLVGGHVHLSAGDEDAPAPHVNLQVPDGKQ